MPNERAGAERLFLAVPLATGTRAALAAYLARMPALPGRGVPAANWHLTLRFLGNTAPELGKRIADEVARASLGGAFGVRFGAPGAFPSAARARVVWLGIDEGAAALHELAVRVGAAVERAGAPPEPRSFAAHLTLARVRPPQDVRTLLARAPAAAVEMTVREVVLMRSELGGPAARYHALRSFPLEDA